jgi:hypothetical protein
LNSDVAIYHILLGIPICSAAYLYIHSYKITSILNLDIKRCKKDTEIEEYIVILVIHKILFYQRLNKSKISNKNNVHKQIIYLDK